MTGQSAAIPISATNVEAPRAPTGAVVVSAFGAVGLGFGLSTWLVPHSWQTAVLVGVVALAISLAAMRGLARSAGPWLANLLVSVFLATLVYWMGLGMAIPGLLLVRHAIGPWVAFPLMILLAALGPALPVVALVGLARRLGASAGRVLPEAPPLSRVDSRPALLMAAVSVVATAIGFAAVLAVMAMAFMTPGGRIGWRLVAVVVTWLGLPFVLVPIAAGVYRALLTRWAVPVPPALTIAEHRLREATGFTFARVICLDAAFGNGRPCFVIVADFNVTLVVSAQIVQRLTPDALLAVLAHEAAHVHFHHGRRKLLWGVAATVGYAGAAFVLNRLSFALLPAGAGFVRVLIPMLPLLFLRQLYDLRVTRRHEAEADDYAVAVAGAAPLLSALEAIGGTGRRERWTHNRWPTHGTWERRSARIRSRDESSRS